MMYCARTFYFKFSGQRCRDENLYIGKDDNVYQYALVADNPLVCGGSYQMIKRDDLFHDEEWYDDIGSSEHNELS